MDNASITVDATKKTRASRGRQRIEIKKLEDEAKRQVTFSKRRRGLFKKAKELSTLCGAEVAVLALTKAGNLYTTDDADTVLDRFLVESSSDGSVNPLLKQKEVEEKEEEKGGFWWDQPIENLDTLELLEYAMALNDLRENVTARLEELSIKNSTSLWPWVADQDVNEADFGVADQDGNEAEFGVADQDVNEAEFGVADQDMNEAEFVNQVTEETNYDWCLNSTMPFNYSMYS